MTSKHNFKLHDDNFWTNAFRLCDELRSEAESTTDDEEDEVKEAPPPSAARPRLCLKRVSKRDEWHDEDHSDVPPDHWDDGRDTDSHASSWDLQRTASTPGGGDSADDEDVRSEIWSDSSQSLTDSHHPMLSNQHIPVIDDKYMEYYEFLADGFDKLVQEVESHRPALPKWMLAVGDLERGGDRIGRFPPRPQRRANDRYPMASFECGEKAGLGCPALKPKLYHQHNPGPEVYSRKVFVGGLPVDVDEDELITTFSPFGHLCVDWPNKQMNGMPGTLDRTFPPKGYVFLIFQYEQSVRKLVEACTSEEEKLFFAISSPMSPQKLFFAISSPMSPQKLVQIRPWKLADADYIVDVNMPINPRRVIFVGGVPRPIRAVELAHIMDKLYGSVVCAGIDTDLEYKYPKGAGRVAFTNEASFIRAITDRYAQLSHGEQRVRVEMKPYVLDDQPCDECDGMAARHAPFFCPHLECLQYYCESCWTELHACPTREHHKPLVKEA